MKKLLLSLAFVAGITVLANAQTEGAVQKLSIGAEAGLPFDKGTSGLMMAGGSIQYELPVVKSFNLLTHIGYLSVFSTEKGIRGNQGHTTFKAGGKYYFGSNFYFNGDLGVGIKRDGGRAAFAFATGFGRAFAVADQSSLDFGLRYENWSRFRLNSSFVALRAAFTFGL